MAEENNGNVCGAFEEKPGSHVRKLPKWPNFPLPHSRAVYCCFQGIFNIKELLAAL